jgi:hypothetical protein
METIQPPKTDNAVLTYYRPNEILGRYTEDINNRHQAKVVFNFHPNHSIADEADNNVKLIGVDVTITIPQTPPDTDEDEVIKMLESWLQEDITEEGEKSLEKLLKTLKENPISFAEIT